VSDETGVRVKKRERDGESAGEAAWGIRKKGKAAKGGNGRLVGSKQAPRGIQEEDGKVSEKGRGCGTRTSPNRGGKEVRTGQK